MTAIVRNLARSVTLAALALALLAVSGCASDVDYRQYEDRYDDPYEQQRLPGFTPFSA